MRQQSLHRSWPRTLRAMSVRGRRPAREHRTPHNGVRDVAEDVTSVIRVAAHVVAGRCNRLVIRHYRMKGVEGRHPDPTGVCTLRQVVRRELSVCLYEFLIPWVHLPDHSTHRLPRLLESLEARIHPPSRGGRIVDRPSVQHHHVAEVQVEVPVAVGSREERQHLQLHGLVLQQLCEQTLELGVPAQAIQTQVTALSGSPSRLPRSEQHTFLYGSHGSVDHRVTASNPVHAVAVNWRLAVVHSLTGLGQATNHYASHLCL
mmetsp:Transcript_27507/g.43956  ORF Transcript_27507/g.43956 Transcript_27507/m.43956 type:complete len:260 (-) Transcript_27507:194-973(-)